MLGINRFRCDVKAKRNKTQTQLFNIRGVGLIL
ncbi:hypothetical protein KPB2_5485 [Klebsiella pneumoniae Kb677]|nr:hypothetical protein KPB2_5485 [Klebsiella pneumoniae Kb677]